MQEGILGTKGSGYPIRYLSYFIAVKSVLFVLLNITYHSFLFELELFLGSRLWLMCGFVLSFASLVAAMWIMLEDYVLVPGDHANWPGVVLFLHIFLIFVASLVYKFGRTEELWG